MTPPPADKVTVNPGEEARRADREPRPGRTAVLALLVAVVSVAGYLTRPPSPALAWEQVELPSARLNIRSLIAYQAGFAVASEPGSGGATWWSSADGREWTSSPLPSAPIRLVPDRAGLIGYDARSAFRIAGTGVVSVLPLPQLLRTGYGSGRPGLVSGPRGLIAHTVAGDVWRTAGEAPFQMVVNAARWRTATDISEDSHCSPPGRTGPDLPPVVSTPVGFFAFVAADDASGVWPVCEPIPWTSADGAIWKREAALSPFGPGAYVRDVTWAAGRFVAVGGVSFDQPAVWVSIDGLEWVPVPSPPSADPYELVEVEGGPLGFVAAARFTQRTGHTAWVSATGDCWEALPAQVAGRGVAVGSASVLITDRTRPGVAYLGVPSSLPLTVTCTARTTS